MKRLMFVAICLCAAFGVAAQMRMIPADAQRGRLAAVELGTVRIDDKIFRMAPGARVLSANNLTMTPNQVPVDVPVRYQVDGQGQIRTIWILTPDEAARR